jgi:nucleoside-triphosphatase
MNIYQKQVILLTGVPGCGKTTLIRKIIAGVEPNVGGFYTQEIRLGGVRQGFKIITIDGQRGILAHVDIRSSPRVGKYGVDIQTLDLIAVSAVQHAIQDKKLIIIDEIGPMENKSAKFRHVVLEAIESESDLLASIALRSTPYTDRIKSTPDIQLIEVRPDNRERLVDHVRSILNI